MISIGKAAQSMAMGAHEQLGEAIEQALVISKYGHLDHHYCQQNGWQTLESAHPVPDEASFKAGESLLGMLSEPSSTPLLVLISGGASSLVEVPVDGVDLAFLKKTNEWLLGSGLDIVSMNWVRKGLSRIKGGGLLNWLQGRETCLLAISDVPGDIPAAIGSGLLTPEPELQQRIETLALPDWLSAKLEAGAEQRILNFAQDEVPQLHIVANLNAAKSAAAKEAESMGYEVRLVSEFVDGEAAQTGRSMAEQLIAGPPGITIWGGETTVNLPQQPGRGGRNQHLALAAAQVLSGVDGCLLLSAGTDGTDGPTEDAGALVDGESLKRVEGVCDVEQSLAAADAGTLLEASGDLIITGPTGTNVMDLVVGLKYAP
jgi:hydroxypyruvate reductase